MGSPTPELPPPPSPSADAGIAPARDQPHHKEHATLPEVESVDIFTLKPLAALRLLCNELEALVKVTDDVPPTPPASRPQTPRGSQLVVDETASPRTPDSARRHRRRPSQWTSDDADVPNRARTPIGSPEARPSEPLQIVDLEIEPLPPQRSAVIRKFYSKKPPPISLEEYLLRLHRYCPMSTAVYLAAGLYIHRLAVDDQILSVTPRNAHRLVLAGLRVAMKALEDLSYPHSRFAKVGGVTEPELGRLEISFCFIRDFNLRVTSEMLTEHVKLAVGGAEAAAQTSTS